MYEDQAPGSPIVPQAGTCTGQQFGLCSITLGSAGTAGPLALSLHPLITPGKYPSAWELLRAGNCQIPSSTHLGAHSRCLIHSIKVLFCVYTGAETQVLNERMGEEGI